MGTTCSGIAKSMIGPLFPIGVPNCSVLEGDIMTVDTKDLPAKVRDDLDLALPQAESAEQLAYALRATGGYRLQLASQHWLGGDWSEVQNQLRLCDAYLTAAARVEEDGIEQEQG